MGGAASITAIVSPVMVMVMVMVVGLQTTQYSSRLLFVLRRQLDEIHLPSRKLRLQSPPKSKVVQRLRPNPAQESFYSTILPLRRPELRAPKASFPLPYTASHVSVLCSNDAGLLSHFIIIIIIIITPVTTTATTTTTICQAFPIVCQYD